MENKQTAVEKFIEQLEEQGESWENVSIGRIQISIKVEDYLDLINQAKEMEKEQIIDFAAQWEARKNEGNLDSMEMLYNETYNK